MTPKNPSLYLSVFLHQNLIRVSFTHDWMGFFHQWSDSVSLKMHTVHSCYMHFLLFVDVYINSVLNQASEPIFMESGCCRCVHTVCMCLCLGAHYSSCTALSCLPLCVWFLCCGAGITPGISRILAAPIDGTEMTVLIMCSPALTPRYFPDLKWHKQQITRVRQQGKKSHITQWRLGWANSCSAARGYSTQTWRSVSHGPVWAGLGGCRRYYSAVWK